MQLATRPGTPQRERTRERGRRGAGLVLFVLLVFALMAIAAVTVDIGMASLSQAQMQDAVDSAALEGHRWRQYEEEDIFSDQRRRARASQFVGMIFDDDLDPSNGDLMGFGAGPIFESQGGVGGAPQGLDVPDTHVYDPELERNLFNVVHGDIVSGDYDPNAAHVEASDYQRTDFIPAMMPGSWLADALLVRMRRTSMPTNNDNVASQSSSGPGLPLLFGHGSTIHAEDAATYDPRRDGLTVRATAIAAAQPARYVGDTPLDGDGNRMREDPDDPLSEHDHLGAVPFAVSLDFWNSHTLLDPGCVVVNVVPGKDGGIGQIRAFDVDTQLAGEVVGWFAGDLHQLGNRVLPGAPPSALPLLPENIEGFVPVYEEIGGVPRVVGFGNGALLDPTLAPGGADLCSSTLGTMRVIQKFDTRLPVSGTSASFLAPADGLTSGEWAQVFQLNRVHFTTDRVDASALAPGIVR